MLDGLKLSSYGPHGNMDSVSLVANIIRGPGLEFQVTRHLLSGSILGVDSRARATAYLETSHTDFQAEYKFVYFRMKKRSLCRAPCWSHWTELMHCHSGKDDVAKQTWREFGTP